MRRTLLFAILFLYGSALAVAQSTPPHEHSAHSMAEHSDHSEHSGPMCQMMQEHMADLKAMSQTLNTNLAQMKSTLPLINDINERSRWQSNIAMWQALADHFNQMSRHAEHMQGMGMGCGMMDHGTKTEKPKETPEKPQ